MRQFQVTGDLELAVNEMVFLTKLCTKEIIGARNNKREQALDLAQKGNNKSMVEMLFKHKDENKLFGVF